MAGKIKAIAIGDNRIDLVDKSVIGDLDSLNTTAKDSIVNALNEVNNKQGGGASYTAGNGIDITGDSISITQANLDKIAAVDDKADKTALDNTKNTLTNLITANTSTLRKDLVAYDTYNSKVAELEAADNKKIDKIDATEGTPFNTGITLNGKPIYKVIYKDIATQSNNISQLMTQLINNNLLLDTKVCGYSTIEEDQTVHFPASNLIFFQGAAGIIYISINTVGGVTQEAKVLDGSLTNITAIEITFLGD